MPNFIIGSPSVAHNEQPPTNRRVRRRALQKMPKKSLNLLRHCVSALTIGRVRLLPNPIRVAEPYYGLTKSSSSQRIPSWAVTQEV